MNVGLRIAGKLEFVLSIPVKTFKEARQSWARTTGHLDPCWDAEKGTYFGWPVVKTRTKGLNRSETKPLFYY
jgi:hypothetical protein